MPDQDDRPSPPADVHWRAYKLRRLTVATSIINAKHCRVSEIGEGYIAIEVDGLEPVVNEEPFAIAQTLAEKMAYAGVLVRRVTDPDGESYR